MELDFRAHIWFWKGPAPWYFVTVPEPHSQALKAVAGAVTYGWGMIPVHVRLGKSEWETALWPKGRELHRPDQHQRAQGGTAR